MLILKGTHWREGDGWSYSTYIIFFILMQVGAAMGGLWGSSTLYFGFGLIFALDTLVSQAYGASSP